MFVLMNLLNRRIFGYIAIIIIALGVFIYQKLQISKLESQISQIKLQLKEYQNHLTICKANVKTFKENISSKDTIINQLQKEIDYQKSTCQNLLQKKEKLIKQLQKIRTIKPKDIKPTVIIKKECKLKIETGEQLHEKDYIFDTLSNIGK